MAGPALRPVFAVDIAADGRATPVTDPWPTPRPAPGAAWRWLHLELSDAGLEPWLAAHVPPVAADALLQPETRPRATALGAGLIVNLRGVNLNPGAEAEDMVSLRLWVEAALVVSVRIRKLYSVEELRAAAEAGQAPPTPGDFLAALAEALTDRIEAVSLTLEADTDTLEETILDRDEAGACDTLAPLRRKAIRLRRFIGPQREALVRLAEGGAMPVGHGALALLGESANRTTRAVEELDAVSARLTALNDHVEAQRGLRMARNGYVLSVVAAVFLPLGFLTGLFGVNVAGMPGMGWPWAFAVLAAVNVALGAGLLVLFRALRWL